MSAVTTDLRPDGVVVLTLDQPDSRVNVLTEGLWADLEAAVDSLAAQTDIRGLVLASAKPGVFVAGADLNLLANATGPNDPTVRAFLELGLRVLAKLEAVPFPTCAAIDGAALGGGLEVALACDYRIAGSGEKVALGLPEVKLGLIPGWGGTQRLPRIVGLDQATQLLTTGNPANRDHAARARLVDAVTDSATLIDAAAGLVLNPPTGRDRRAARRGSLSLNREPTARMPSVMAPVAVREAFRAMTSGVALPLEEGLKIETEAFLRLAGSAESKQLIAAFFAGRKK